MGPLHKKEFIKLVKSTPPILTDFMEGLSSEQVKQREKSGLVNKVPKKVTKTYWQIFFDNFFSFFNLIYFVIAVLMIVADIRRAFAYFFLIPIISNIIIGLITDIHARHLVDRLRLITEEKIKVMRDGREVSLPTASLVLSDIVVLTSGDQVPSDGVLVNGRLSMDESLVTGEAEAIEKVVGSKVLSGSYVKAGKAYIRLERIGIASYAEGLQDTAKAFVRPKSELKSSCLRIFWTTGIIAIIIGAFSILTWFLSRPLTYESFQALMPSLSGSLVAMIPAGLYLLVSLTLGVGVVHLARQRMNVQELYCIEMLARVDTICFDKTGTLTDGHLAVKDFYNYSDFTDSDLQSYLGSLIKATGDDNATARAIREAYSAGQFISSASIPFDSGKKCSAATFDSIGTFVLGAPDFLEATIPPIAEDRIRHLTERGYRALGLFYSKKSIRDGASLPGKLILVAVISLSDHLKPDAKANIAWFRQNDVQVKVISGDNPITVSEIANEAGVPHAADYISMKGIKDADIPTLASHYAVFGRVSPTQKALLVSSLQNQGHKVAMTGDGVNDILALKTADCSIAMASGSAAAKNVAHMVSVDNDFSKLPIVVQEGRRVINNLQRTASLFLSKTIFAIVLSLFFMISFWAHIGEGYPFKTQNMVVWELVTIGGGGFFLALEPTKDRVKGSFMENVMIRAIPAGIAEIVGVIIIFAIKEGTPNFFSEEEASTLATILFTGVSFLVLFRVSRPFDAYRRIVFIGLSLFAVLFFFLDAWTRHGSFGLYYHDITLNQWSLCAGLFFGIVLLYFSFDFFSDKMLTIIKERMVKKHAS